MKLPTVLYQYVEYNRGVITTTPPNRNKIKGRKSWKETLKESTVTTRLVNCSTTVAPHGRWEVWVLVLATVLLHESWNEAMVVVSVVEESVEGEVVTGYYKESALLPLGLWPPRAKQENFLTGFFFFFPAGGAKGVSGATSARRSLHIQYSMVRLPCRQTGPVQPAGTNHTPSEIGSKTPCATLLSRWWNDKGNK